MPPLAQAPDQAVAVEYGMDGAGGRDAHVAREPAHQHLADLAGAPVRLLAFAGDDQHLHLGRQLVGVSHWPPGAVGESHRTLFPVALEQLIAGLARDPEGPAHIAHRLAFQQPGDKAKTFFHHGGLCPRHRHLPRPARTQKVSPMSPERNVTYLSGRTKYLAEGNT